MAMSGQLLKGLGFADADTKRLVDCIRQDRYQELQSYFHGVDVTPGTFVASRLRAVQLSIDSAATNRRTSELQLDELGVQVIAVLRRGERDEQPTTDTRLAEGDVLIFEGDPEALELAEQRWGPS